MKVRIREPKLAILKRNGKRCPCCDHLNWKDKIEDKIMFKEALEQCNVEFSVADSTPGCDPV